MFFDIVKLKHSTVTHSLLYILEGGISCAQDNAIGQAERVQVERYRAPLPFPILCAEYEAHNRASFLILVRRATTTTT